MMDELLEQFLVEGRDLVAEAHVALTALGSDPADRAAIDALFRATHTLKGSVALFDMAPAERLLHAAETRLEGARKGESLLDGETLDSLLAAIDQTDRWIDAMEHAGGLDGSASSIADQFVEQLAGGAAAGRSSDGDGAEVPDWLGPLLAHPDFADVDRTRAATAFRYTPDADCFFRGDDPLAIAAAVPDLLALSIAPADDVWPDLALCEPFRCMSVIEGISAADADQVRAAFRLVPDQIMIASLTQSTTADVDPRAALRGEAANTLRIDAARLDRLADQSGELSVAIRALGPLIDRIRRIDPALATAFDAANDEIARTAGAVQRSVAQVRLVSLEPVLRRLPRLARDAATSLGKTIRFAIDGESVQVDKQIADQLFEPLLHLVRNAIDHGIEASADRTAASKAPKGQLTLSIRQDGDNVVITFTDDGRGINPDRIRKTATAKGLISDDAAGALTDAEAMRLIFLPGFSTSVEATSLSGRGVGMDAVRATVDRLGGTIAIDSKAGQHTRITLRLPANAIVTPLLIVEAGDQRIGIRLEHIVETARIASSEIQPIGQGRVCILRDATVPVLDLAEMLGRAPIADDLARLVVTDVGPSRTAVRVGSFGERFDAVIRQSSGLLSAIPAVSGTTMMADGSVLLVLDLPELVA